MRVKEKLMMELDGLKKKGPVNIVFFGDSITHGSVNGYRDYENVYWNVLKKMLNNFRDLIPVNVIDAGIGGTTATESLSRIDSQVLSHNADLIVICFGLNDINDPIDKFLSSLKQIFLKCKANADVIYMTPNMFNTYVSDDTPEELIELACNLSEFQNSGKMDMYMDNACKLARSVGVRVCDCYSKWKMLSKDKDTTLLLANRTNHPVPEMHKLFAQSLYEIIME